MKWFDNLRRIAAWMPLLWRDRDWDEAFLVKIVQFKLARMAKSLENGSSVTGPKDARRIRIVIAHFDRWQDIRRFVSEPKEPFPESKLEPTADGHWLAAHRPAPPVWRRHWAHCDALETWHWEEAWRKIAQYGRGWWD